jgi:hypothetical protein
VLIRWRCERGPFEVRARRRGHDWRVLRDSTHKRHVVVWLARGHWTFQVRSRPPFAEPGPWARTPARI